MSHIDEKTKQDLQEQLRDTIRVHIKDQLAVEAHKSAVEKGYIREEEEPEELDEEEETESEDDEDEDKGEDDEASKD
ncbi:MAG: hypothetical protein CMF22_11170 [Idiomarinaceae bacterium]|nr:hypothetical protein [Idiomarinaceae bacterium]|tara:strand:- start:158 stop:388 length:231 start_codon:yes stop_codon:yes gene_type:complete